MELGSVKPEATTLPAVLSTRELVEETSVCLSIIYMKKTLWENNNTFLYHIYLSNSNIQASHATSGWILASTEQVRVGQHLNRKKSSYMCKFAVAVGQCSKWLSLLLQQPEAILDCLLKITLKNIFKTRSGKRSNFIWSTAFRWSNLLQSNPKVGVSLLFPDLFKKSVAQDCTLQKLTPIHNELFT